MLDKLLQRVNRPIFYLQIPVYAIILVCYGLLSLSCNNNNEVRKSNRFQSLRPTNSSVSMPDSVVSYLNAALDTMHRYSIYRDSINWTVYRKNILEKAMGAQS